jgi:hypothetical protein
LVAGWAGAAVVDPALFPLCAVVKPGVLACAVYTGAVPFAGVDTGVIPRQPTMIHTINPIIDVKNLFLVILPSFR